MIEIKIQTNRFSLKKKMDCTIPPKKYCIEIQLATNLKRKNLRFD